MGSANLSTNPDSNSKHTDAYSLLTKKKIQREIYISGGNERKKYIHIICICVDSRSNSSIDETVPRPIPTCRQKATLPEHTRTHHTTLYYGFVSWFRLNERKIFELAPFSDCVDLETTVASLSLAAAQFLLLAGGVCQFLCISSTVIWWWTR